MVATVCQNKNKIPKQKGEKLRTSFVSQSDLTMDLVRDNPETPHLENILNGEHNPNQVRSALVK